MGPSRFPCPPHTLLLYISSSPLPISPRVPVHWPTSLTHWPLCLNLHTETHTNIPMLPHSWLNIFLYIFFVWRLLRINHLIVPKGDSENTPGEARGLCMLTWITHGITIQIDLCLMMATVMIFKLAFESSIHVLWASWCFLGSYWVIW